MVQDSVSQAKAPVVGLRQREHGRVVDHHHLAPPPHWRGVAQVEQGQVRAEAGQLHLLPGVPLAPSDLDRPAVLQAQRRDLAGWHGDQQFGAGHQVRDGLIQRAQGLTGEPFDPGHGASQESPVDQVGLT